MSRHEDALPEYLFDALAPDERRAFEAAAAAAPALGREVAEGQELVTSWALRQVKPEAPPPALRQRLLDTVSGVDRFRPFFHSIGRLFDLTEAGVRAVLARVDGTLGWSSLAGGGRYFHFQAGASLAAEETGVVRLPPGAMFPRHLHRAGETTLVLDGLMLDRGRIYGPGAIVEAEPGTVHDYRAEPGRDLILVSRHGGIEMVDGSPPLERR